MGAEAYNCRSKGTKTLKAINKDGNKVEVVARYDLNEDLFEWNEITTVRRKGNERQFQTYCEENLNSIIQEFEDDCSCSE